jgi:hypothetical protein
MEDFNIGVVIREMYVSEEASRLEFGSYFVVCSLCIISVALTLFVFLL